MTQARSLDFENRAGKRYWWFHLQNCKYIPPIFSVLSDEEWDVIDEWYNDTDERVAAGECNVPALSILQGLIMGNGIKAMVQCGHAVGFSALLCGFYFRAMGRKDALFSVDIDAEATAFANRYVLKAGLQDYVHLEVCDSSDSSLPEVARKYFKGSDIALVFIDSSHRCDHTLRELDLWYSALPVGGLIVLHDVSKLAGTFDVTKAGGVHAALGDWLKANHCSALSLNGYIASGCTTPVYLDGCGLGIIQKTPDGEK
jgi:predicted O-methyltransferase YrrM